MSPTRLRPALALLLAGLGSVAVNGCGGAANAALKTEVDSLRTALAAVTAANATAAARLATFDTLDFDVYTNQKWDRLHESHANDILVHWPDGHTTKGIEPHIADLKGQFIFAPDTKISEHPIRIASGDWTAVTGTMTGTFSKPMPLGNGKFIQPTGKSFSVPMATIGHWKGGVMDEEYLYWDNQTFMKQIGLAK